MKRLGVGVIGVGFWGQNHARVYNELKKTELIGVSDIDKRRAANVASKYGCIFFEKNDDLLNNEEIDAVSICTPTSSHLKVSLKAIERGKHLLVEKPLGKTLRGATRVVKEAEKNKIILLVGHIERFNPAVQKLKELIQQKILGDIILIFSRRVTPWPQRIGDVGVVKDSAIHDIDVMIYLLETDVDKVYAKIGNLRHKFEDYTAALLNFKNGIVGFLDANWLSPKKIRRLIVTGSEATATLDYIEQLINIENSKGVKTIKSEWEEPLKLELSHFADIILKGRAPSVAGIDALKAIQVCEGILKSGISGKEIRLKKINI